MSGIKTVFILGGGIEGSQIAIQCAINDFKVMVYSRSKESVEKCKSRLKDFQAQYQAQIEKMIASQGKCKESYAEGLHMDPATFTEEIGKEISAKIAAVCDQIVHVEDITLIKDADIVIECIAENKKEKGVLFTQISEHLREDAIVCTNTSSMIPSMFVQNFKKPERFLAMHFCNMIWRRNLVEIMGHPKTDAAVVEKVKEFAKEIKMVPVVVRIETPGYIINSLLNPWIHAAEKMWVSNMAEPQEIDTVWKKATGAIAGPFLTLDIVGFKTKINLTKYALSKKPGDETLTKILQKYEEMVSRGLLGKCGGEGFYKYK